MHGDSPEAYLNTPPVQYRRQVLRARGQCTVLSPEQLPEIRPFELPAVADPDACSAELLPCDGKLLPAPRS